MISHDLTEKFIRNPRLFLKQFLIQIPIGDTNFRTNVFDDYIFKPNYRNRAFDLTQKQASPIAIAELSLKKDKDTDICAYPISSTTSITANWAPYNPRNVQEITLRHETRFFFTAELSGCSIAISDQLPHVVLHIPPEKRLLTTNCYLRSKFPNLTFRFLTPEKHYCALHNKRTVVIGVKNLLNQKWKFYLQTYVPCEFSSLSYKSYFQSGYDLVRLSALQEF